MSGTNREYEIHYKLLGEPHTDRITDLDVPVTDVIRELATKHLIAVNDAQYRLFDFEPGLPIVGISDVSIHKLEDEVMQ
ncbi:hypothetical protein IQ22_03468 [Pseudomonas duriflava]|uniref:Uncharacterized protein n=1 Tax=Pseudomonas duriflava TaxID=459528 RepID=A0A562Q6C9_9PSED|nr:hypothetical protein [Pseudomonas duriflava]TWI52325.1 hypothetical protein IQ22_03468 [Pseudomonas duriflava]